MAPKPHVLIRRGFGLSIKTAKRLRKKEPSFPQLTDDIFPQNIPQKIKCESAKQQLQVFSVFLIPLLFGKVFEDPFWQWIIGPMLIAIWIVSVPWTWLRAVMTTTFKDNAMLTKLQLCLCLLYMSCVHGSCWNVCTFWGSFEGSRHTDGHLTASLGSDGNFWVDLNCSLCQLLF